MPSCSGSFGEKMIKIKASEAKCVEDDYYVAEQLCD